MDWAGLGKFLLSSDVSGGVGWLSFILGAFGLWLTYRQVTLARDAALAASDGIQKSREAIRRFELRLNEINIAKVSVDIDNLKNILRNGNFDAALPMLDFVKRQIRGSVNIIKNHYDIPPNDIERIKRLYSSIESSYPFCAGIEKNEKDVQRNIRRLIELQEIMASYEDRISTERSIYGGA